MKYLKFILPALLLFFPLHAAHAESALCAQIKNLPPVSSHYVQKVLDRAKAGIAYAQSASQNSDFDRNRASWARAVASGWAGLIDSRLTLTAEQRELPRVTACMHFDTLLLDCAMDDVRQELRTQIDRGSFVAIRRLLSLLSFLQERKSNLLRGALDPLYSDPSWNETYEFDATENVWCCPGSVPGNACTNTTEQSCAAGGGITFDSLNACTAWGCVASSDVPPPEEEEVMCPFDADYAPAFQSGFGCDVETMGPRTAYVPMQAESDALSALLQQVNDYREGADQVNSVQRDMDALFENPTTAPAALEPREHLEAFSCGWTGGYCDDDFMKKCTSNKDCSESVSCVIPDKICEGNRAIRCNADFQCGDAGPCIEGATLPTTRELRGSFSLGKDQIAILSDFLGTRVAEELSREFRDDLKLPEEFDVDETEKAEDRAFAQRNPFTQSIRAATRQETQSWSRLQARQESLIFPEAIDAPLEIAESLHGLRSAVSMLSKLASEKDGVRQFVARYAYFIGRTCIYRPCQLMLEQVIRIVTTDECFPYTNGEYVSDDESNPRWKKCQEEAGIIEE